MAVLIAQEKYGDQSHGVRNYQNMSNVSYLNGKQFLGIILISFPENAS